MSPEEAKAVMNSGEFQSFFDNATRLVERVSCGCSTLSFSCRSVCLWTTLSVRVRLGMCLLVSQYVSGYV